ncbi:MAG: alpha/beta hydrolase [bacterium]|nr:alpha/beta hydrolase [bacterium]
MLIWVAVIGIGFFLVLAGYVYFGQSRLVFFPGKELVIQPDEVGLSYEDVYLASANGKKIHGWYFPPDDSSLEFPVVLFCHGNAGNISHRLETAQLIHSLGAGLLMFDYQGYGRSEGEPSESGIYADSRSCYDWLIKEKSITADRVVPFGRSLGGAPAVQLAESVDCRGLVVESSFTSAKGMGRVMFPFLPVSLLIKYGLNSLARIENVNCKLLITHSRTDEIIPYEMGQQLFEAAREPKRFVELSGGHNDLAYFRNPDYLEALRWILSEQSVGKSELD